MAPSTVNRWIRPEVYPLFAALSVAVGICGFQLVRNMRINPEVRLFMERETLFTERKNVVTYTINIEAFEVWVCLFNYLFYGYGCHSRGMVITLRMVKLYLHILDIVVVSRRYIESFHHLF